MPTIAIDFDGVIHAYSKGWHDGTCYDDPIPGALEAIEKLMETHSVFIFSTRKRSQIHSWLMKHCYDHDWDLCGMGDDPRDFQIAKYNFIFKEIPFWVKFWNKKNVLGITKRKLPAVAYIDDRAINFNGDWKTAMEAISNFKTYQEKAKQ